jgi:GNAT superfamily N-acetyltransferase
MNGATLRGSADGTPGQFEPNVPSAPIIPFDIRFAGARECAALAAFRNHLRAEQQPGDPPVPVAEYVRRMRNVSSGVSMSVWAAWNTARTEVVACGGVDYVKAAAKTQPVNFRISVLPHERRRGLGARLLSHVVEVVRRADRPLMTIQTCGRVAAGEAFMSRVGATACLRSSTEHLVVAELDRELLRDWLERGGIRAEEFELVYWSDAYPDDQIEAIAALYNVINQQPRDGLKLQDIHYTPAHVRAVERRAFGNGTRRWSVYARVRANGRLAGFTEVYGHPNRPAFLRQNFTGVFPEDRNKGLGRWLKAAMLEKIISECPQVKFIRTDTAESNAAMRRINALLGFKPYLSNCTWQLETERATEYLARRASVHMTHH